MNPIDLDLVVTIVASILVLACGAGAVLVLPWERAQELRPPVPEPEPARDPSVIQRSPWAEAT
jgi:hypothetical protein